MNRVWSAAYDAKITGEAAYWHACTNTPLDAAAPEWIRRAVACERKFNELFKASGTTWAAMETLRRLRNAATNYGVMAADAIGSTR